MKKKFLSDACQWFSPKIVTAFEEVMSLPTDIYDFL
jgi:hypothetical protein